ncbi:MAG: exo-alpha-sialidase [Chitinophagaceae bacterium]|nr:MAG: exo-alpha-sialidase [Chitinophagaceae bacterium]
MKKLIVFSVLPLVMPLVYLVGIQTSMAANLNVGKVLYSNSIQNEPTIWKESDGEMASDTSVNPQQIFFHFRKTQILFNANILNGRKYCAFPSTVKLNDSTVLISYKRGYAHYKDTGFVGLIRYDPRIMKVISRGPIYKTKYNNQNTEILKMPNGDVVIYVDRQMPGPKKRIGLEELRSTDDGITWKDMGTVGLVNGVQFGYAFDDYIEGHTIYALWMTFPELRGSEGERSVHVVKSNNNGESWTDIKDLTKAYKKAFNESTLVKYNNGFLIVARADEKGSAFIFKTDSNFNLIKEKNLSSVYSCIDAIGRPKLFVKDGSYYMICRNNSCLFFYKINPATLSIEKWARLYRSPGWGGDAHYAEPYFQQEGNKTYFNVIDYFPVNSRFPEIVRFEFKWAELR